VDDVREGGKLYPSEELHQWKTDHEGHLGAALSELCVPDEGRLTEILERVFSPPLDRLEEIADQLERTGTLNAASLAELREIVGVLRYYSTGPQESVARTLGYAAEVFGSSRFSKAASDLSHAAEALPSVERRLSNLVNRLGGML